jgi:hypothetical protein
MGFENIPVWMNFSFLCSRETESSGKLKARNEGGFRYSLGIEKPSQNTPSTVRH